MSESFINGNVLGKVSGSLTLSQHPQTLLLGNKSCGLKPLSQKDKHGLD